MTVLVDPRPALRKILIDDAAVAALIAQRVDQTVLPQNQTMPAVTYTEISSVGDQHMQGPSGLAQSRIQFTCWGRTPAEVSQVALAVKAALDGFKGVKTFGSNSPPDSVTFRGVLFQSSQDLYDDTALLYYRALDFTCWYAES